MSKMNVDKLAAPNLMWMTASALFILHIASSSRDGAGDPFIGPTVLAGCQTRIFQIPSFQNRCHTKKLSPHKA